MKQKDSHATEHGRDGGGRQKRHGLGAISARSALPGEFLVDVFETMEAITRHAVDSSYSFARVYGRPAPTKYWLR